ncbi:MAG: nitrilase-related carbon-nitrogen hydrolase [Bacteroidota bacterium]|nr:nitrilase-related carbon-nitrogen hydrolase [Bacteroidota bacterium]
MIVAAFQFRPQFRERRDNLARIEGALRDVDADLAVFPELATTGYFFRSVEDIAALAETVEGETCSMLRDIAVAKRMTIVCGFAESARGNVFNSAALVTPAGELSVYRKVHLFGEEKRLFTPGDTGFFVVNTGDARVGVMICYDWRFPEAARSLALKGAQVICHPSALVAEPRLWKPVMRTRSFENRVVSVTADRTGSEKQGETMLVFHGSSQIVDVNGDVLAEADETFEGWVRAVVDPSRADVKTFSPWNDIFADRRPEMYTL